MEEALELGDLPHGHISYSAYAQYLRCPYQYYLRHIEGLKERPKGSLILGKGTHAGLEWSFNEHLKEGFPPKKSLVQEAAVAAINETFKEIPGSEIEFSNGDCKDRLKDDSVKMLGVYDEIRTSLEPKTVEKQFSISFTNTDYSLEGRVDLETHRGEIIDFKTTARSPARNAAEISEQLTTYQLQADHPKSLELHVLIRTKVPDYDVLKSPLRPKEQVDDLLGNIAKVATLIKAGIFPKILEGAPGSACSWCGFYERCRGKKRPEK